MFVTAGVATGLLLTIQFRSSIPSSTYIYDELKAQQELIDSYLSDQVYLKNKITTLRNEINEAQKKAEQYVETNNLEVLNKLKNELGLSAMKGEGISIRLDDGLFIDRQNHDVLSQSVVNASDLRDIVNAARAGKATAIAINDQRIIATTAITTAGSTILINNYHVLPPFSISIIGDPELLLQSLKNEMLLSDINKRVRDLKIQMQIETAQNLNVPIFNGNFSTKYLSPAQ